MMGMLSIVAPKKSTKCSIKVSLIETPKWSGETYCFSSDQGSHKLWKSWKTWKITKKVPCMEKSWNLKNPWYSWKNHGNLWNNLTKPPVATSCQTQNLCVWQLLSWLLVVSSFNYLKCMVYKHAYLNTVLLLHSAFLLSVVKMPLKGRLEAMH